MTSQCIYHLLAAGTGTATDVQQSVGYAAAQEPYIKLYCRQLEALPVLLKFHLTETEQYFRVTHNYSLIVGYTLSIRPVCFLRQTIQTWLLMEFFLSFMINASFESPTSLEAIRMSLTEAALHECHCLTTP